jgi:hypothetical protein
VPGKDCGGAVAATIGGLVGLVDTVPAPAVEA